MSADDLIAKLSAPAPEARAATGTDPIATLSEAVGALKRELARPLDPSQPTVHELWMRASAVVGSAEVAIESLATAPQVAVEALPCTGCVIDAKQAAMVGKPIPEPLPGTVMINGMLLCDVRHTLNVGAPQLLIAQPGQVPGGLG